MRKPSEKKGKKGKKGKFLSLGRERRGKEKGLSCKVERKETENGLNIFFPPHLF